MKRRLFSLLLVVSLTGIQSPIAQPIRIACIGGSITFGKGMVNRERNHFPAQLQELLGPQYIVTNYGIEGSTMLRKGDRPYWVSREFQNARTTNPDIVFIELGSNDSKMPDRMGLDAFEKDCSDYIDSFRLLPSHPRVVLLLPPPSLLTDTQGIHESILRDRVRPAIRNLAYTKNCELIDLPMLFAGHPELMPDSLHPSSLGAGLIARRLYEVVIQKENQPLSLSSIIPKPSVTTPFHGYRCVDFTYKGRNCKVVFPKRTAKGAPWIWRARFWGHEPQTDIALLERGFHVVYCDVVELFGNAEAISIWNGYYAFLRNGGLGPKAVLEGMSRGGLYIYNWALANPDKTACIYADAPVLDPKSWPGGKGKSKGSASDWELFRKAFGLTEASAASFRQSPLDRAKTIAKLGFPMLHVVGDADEVVPVDENTGPFESKIKAAGGQITVIHKPGIGHHPHSLADPSPIVDFILRATGRKTNYAIVPAPGNEYRSAAGWTEGTDWWQQRSDIDSLLQNNSRTDIIFLGNSITQGIAGQRPHVTYRPGLKAFSESFAGYEWVAAGISGDKTQQLLWRLEHGAYKKANPRFLVLTIGVNNFPDQTAAETTAGIKAILNWLQTHLPATEIILIGPLPAGTQATDERRLFYNEIQASLKTIKRPRVHYLPMARHFLLADGRLDPELYSQDGIHLIEKGYAVWARVLKEKIEMIVSGRK